MNLKVKYYFRRFSDPIFLKKVKKNSKHSNVKQHGAPATSLYFIAVVPDPYFQEQVIRIKEHIRDKYGSGHALRSPAHITLHMPFKWRDDRVEKLIRILKGFASKRHKFKVRLQNFGAFEPRVIYIDVEENESLWDLQRDLIRIAGHSLKLDNAQYKQRGFNPHMTVAFRDLKASIFREAWEEYKDKEIEHTFDVRSFVLLKHNGTSWDVFREFLF